MIILNMISTVILAKREIGRLRLMKADEQQHRQQSEAEFLKCPRDKISTSKFVQRPIVF